MTAPAAPDRETLERTSFLFNTNKTLTWDDALAQAGAQLAVERADEAERLAKGRQITASLGRLWSCQCCGQNAGPGSQDGLCPPCRSVVATVVAERRASQQVGGRSRRELAQAFVDHRESLEAS
jgi:hypothetical protein